MTFVCFKIRRQGLERLSDIQSETRSPREALSLLFFGFCEWEEWEEFFGASDFAEEYWITKEIWFGRLQNGSFRRAVMNRALCA